MGKLTFPGFRVPPSPNIKDAKGGREHLCRVSLHLVRMQGHMASLKTLGSATRARAASGQGGPWGSQRACPPPLLTWEAQHWAAQSPEHMTLTDWAVGTPRGVPALSRLSHT